MPGFTARAFFVPAWAHVEFFSVVSFASQVATGI
jgi:hypothetical protein